MKKCKVCGALTDTVFNINFKATPICEECARSIFLQQATWYAKQEFKNLALPRVSVANRKVCPKCGETKDIEHIPDHYDCHSCGGEF